MNQKYSVLLCFRDHRTYYNDLLVTRQTMGGRQ